MPTREFTKYARQGIHESKALIGGYVDITEPATVRADLIGAACLAKEPGLLGPEVDIDYATALFPELTDEVRIPASVYKTQATLPTWRDRCGGSSRLLTTKPRSAAAGSAPTWSGSAFRRKKVSV
jgi:hypothetical protein